MARSLKMRVFRAHSFPMGPMGHVVMCCHCKKILTFDTMTVEHVRPQALGGSNEITNLLPSCGPCNWCRPCEDITEKMAHWFKIVYQHIARQSGNTRRKASKRKRISAGKRVSAKKPKKKNVKRKWFIPNK